MLDGDNRTNRGFSARAAAPSVVTASQDPAAPVDFAHLRRYTFGDRSLEREVLELFLAQLPITIAALRAAGSDHDWRIAAHTLKGSGRAVGAWSLATCAEQAERIQGIADGALRGDQVGRIEKAAAEVRQFIGESYRHD